MNGYFSEVHLSVNAFSNLGRNISVVYDEKQTCMFANNRNSRQISAVAAKTFLDAEISKVLIQ